MAYVTTTYPAATNAESSATVTNTSSLGETLTFGFVCLYILSQAYMVPILLIGPSWAVWQNVTDLSIIALALCIPLMKRDERASRAPLRSLFRIFVTSILLASLSYLVLTLNVFGFQTFSALNTKGVSVGAYQLYRLVQFAVLLFTASSITFNTIRITILRRTVAVAFVLSCLGMAMNYFGLVSTGQFAPHLPKDLTVAGPWAFYSRSIVGSAVGTIGFHHVYPSMQVILLGAIFLHLMPARRWVTESLVLASIVFVSFISSSRMGFVAALLFAVLCMLSRVQRLIVGLVLVVAIVTLCLAVDLDLSVFDPALKRQSTIASSYATDGLAGRVDIWSQRAGLLLEHPSYWLIGTGFGASIESGPNAHLLFLHIIVECGVLGLVLFSLICWRVMVALWSSERGARPVFCATLVLLVSSATQETFYPVPALGHFLGLFLFAVAITLQRAKARSTELQICQVRSSF